MHQLTGFPFAQGGTYLPDQVIVVPGLQYKIGCPTLQRPNYQQKEQRRSTYDDLIEEELYARELSLLIDIAVEKMPPQRRNIFIMSRKDGLSNEEIAQRLNISKRTVENHMTQALAELRKIAYSTLLLFF